MTVADDKDMQDWVVDCNGEGQERAVRDSRDRGVVVMAVAVEDGGSGRRWQRRTTIAVEDNGMQDWAADYDKQGKERVVREGRDSGVGIMAAAAEGGSGRQQWRQWTTAATVDNNSSGRQRPRMMTACKIERQLQGGKRRAGSKQQRH